MDHLLSGEIWSGKSSKLGETDIRAPTHPGKLWLSWNVLEKSWKRPGTVEFLLKSP